MLMTGFVKTTAKLWHIHCCSCIACCILRVALTFIKKKSIFIGWSVCALCNIKNKLSCKESCYRFQHFKQDIEIAQKETFLQSP